MSEIIPPPDPAPPEKPLADPKLPSKKLCAGVGVAIFFVSLGMCLLIPPFFLVGLAVAIVVLFFPGYRFVSVGYFLTLGVILIGTIIYCSTQPFDMK